MMQENLTVERDLEVFKAYSDAIRLRTIPNCIALSVAAIFLSSFKVPS